MPNLFFHLIFWFYITSVFTSSISIFSTIIVYLKTKITWMKFYIAFLILILLILLNYTIFYFIFFYSYRITEILEKIQILFITTLSGFLIYIITRLSLTLYEVKITAIQKRGLAVLLFLFLYFSSVCIIVWQQRLLIISVAVTLAVIGIVCFFSLINFKKILSDKYKKIFIIILLISLSLIPVEFAEYILRLKYTHIKTYIPLGLLTFSVYCFLLSIINLLYNIKHIGISVINNIHNEEISDSFIEKFLITIREKEIIDLLTKGLTYKEIGSKLFISERTVNNHITNIYQKCSVNNKIDLINLIKKY